eukprot:scaffold51016_cov67-Attheya_sp.AAC.2
MHLGCREKALKTECIYFSAFDNEYENSDTSNFMKPVKQEWEPCRNTYDAIKSACMQSNQLVCQDIYLVIPINLCLWGAELWAISEANLCKLKVFHTRGIHSRQAHQKFRHPIYDESDSHRESDSEMTTMLGW